MKALLRALMAASLLCATSQATTIMVVPIFEPLSLHGTDGDEAISETGEALQACVMSRPMALTGAYPEVYVDSICTPHPIPNNNPNYNVKEANLLVLTHITIHAEATANAELLIKLNVSKLSIPEEVDLTARQIVKLIIVAIRKTLEHHQAEQEGPLNVSLVIEGTTENHTSLNELSSNFVVGQVPTEN